MIATEPRSALGPLNNIDGTAAPDEWEFGGLLKQHRLAAGLSQEGLADRASLSTDAISTLERGTRRAPHAGTVGALAAALGLSSTERRELDRTVSRSRGARSAVPATRALAPPQLPLPPTALVDRVDELASARRLICGDSVRLLTLTGPGGVGKTRLALELAHELRGLFPAGVWFVDLEHVADAELVPAAVAQTLGVSMREPGALADALHAAIGDRHVLVILDNFEHVLAAAPWIATVLGACSGLKLLVTSRVRLRLQWEHALQVAPLHVPNAETLGPLEELAAVPAVALFLERAQAANPAFSLTAENAAAVAALCRYLDGLPLALELAAARANVLKPGDMLAWLDRRLPSLTWNGPDKPARHQSLRTAIDGSYRLLDPADQALFRRLAVLSGGWDLNAAAALVGLDGEIVDGMECVARLVDASLVQVSWDLGAGPSFRLLEQMREYAAELLASCEHAFN
jgi:predicted ATPase/DNA-binding XRE family transcriptional regulator